MLGLTFKAREAEPLDEALLAQVHASVYAEVDRRLPDEKLSGEKVIEDLIRLRRELRQAKQWRQADRVRAKLAEAGIVLEDTPQGTVWKRKR